MVKAIGEGGKAHKKEGMDEETQVVTTPSKAPKATPPCILCDVHGHATKNFLNFLHIMSMISEVVIQPNPNVLEVKVTLFESTKKNKYLCTNHPSSLCDT